MIYWIKQQIKNFQKIKAGKTAGTALVKKLSRIQLVEIIKKEKIGNFYNTNDRRLGHALHGYYLQKYNNPPLVESYGELFPEIYWEENDTISKIIWKWFIKEAKKEIDNQ